MPTASETSKATRGTKRVCLACEVRFYDLARNPIVCPACGEQHTPEAKLVIEPGRVASYSAKTDWRSKAFKRPSPTPVEADPEGAAAPEEAVAAEDASEEAAGAGPEDDVVLEQEPDDADVSGLIDHDDVEEPKDR